MQNATMLYRCPGEHITEGVRYDYIIVDATEVDAALADGWHHNWVQADAAFKAAAQKLAANEVELQAVEQQLDGADSLAGAESGTEAAAAAGDAAQPAALTAVHKGAGKWSLVDAAGIEVQTGLTKDAAKAAAAAPA